MNVKNLVELQSNLNAAVQDDTLALNQSLVDIKPVAGFFGTLLKEELVLKGPVIRLASQGSPLIVKGKNSSNWSIKGLDDYALTDIECTLIFSQEKPNASITSSMHIIAFIALDAKPVELCGNLIDSNQLKLSLSKSISDNFPLKILANFVSIGVLDSYLPDGIPLFNLVPLSKLEITFGFSGVSMTSFLLESDINTNWEIIPKVLVIKQTGVTFQVKHSFLSEDQKLLSFGGDIHGVFNVGEKDFGIVIAFQGRDFWQARLVPRDGNILPSLDDLALLAGGNELKNIVADGLQVLRIKEISIDSVCIGFDLASGKLNYISMNSHLTLWDVRFDVYTRLPDFQFAGSMHKDSKISLKELIGNIVKVDENFPEIDITELMISAYPSKKSYSLYIEVTDDWSLQLGGTKVFAIKNVLADFTYTGGEQSSVTGKISGTITLGEMEIIVSAEYDRDIDGLDFKGNTFEGQTISLTKLVNELLEVFDIELPNSIPEVKIKNLNIEFNTRSLQFHFHGETDVTEKTSSGINLCEVEGFVTIDSSVDNTKKRRFSVQVEGELDIGSSKFDVKYQFDDQNTQRMNLLSAEWEEVGSQVLGINDLLEALKINDSLIFPSELDISLKKVKFDYNMKDDIFVLTAESANYGKAILTTCKLKEKQENEVIDKEKEEWHFFFGVDVDKTINLTNLPLIKNLVRQEDQVEIKNIQVVAAPASISGNMVTTINNLIPQGYPRVPADGMAEGISLSMDFCAGSFKTPFNLSISKSSKTDINLAMVSPYIFSGSVLSPSIINPLSEHTAGGALLSARTTADTTPSTAASDGTIWFNVQKTFGPVSFQKVGIRYKENILYVLMDASLGAGGLTISMLGLGVGSSIKEFRPQFSLSGLGIDYKNNAVEIGGLFLKLEPEPPITLELGGAVVVKAKTFVLEAVGAYADLGGSPSMFIFGSVSGTFGGPPFFFITGFAGGFGYNSKLRIPEQNEVYKFPLVAGLTNPEAIGGKNPTPLEVMEKFMGNKTSPGWIKPQMGEIWLAVGIKFTTFKLLNSTALVTAEFGNDFILALIGLSTAKFPMEGPLVYAYIELQLRAVFNPIDGYICFTAVLSPNSYLIDKSCKLTGGFALYFWFGSNEHAGDFVLTLGGYSPYFKVPAWYPQEPRVGLNWSVSSYVSITGEAYFALTPSAIMAGGKLDIRFHDGNLRAWLTAWADIIIWWNPFHFYASIGVSIGASYKMDFLFTSKTFEVELGADLQLWGPETGGTAHIHWWIISFTIDFGAPRTASIDKAQTWDQFVKVLPDAGDATKILPVKGLMPTQPANTKIHGTSTDLNAKTQTETDSKTDWIVRPDNFQFATSSAIPIYNLYVGDKNKALYASGDKLNIQPMERIGLESFTQIYIIREEDGSEVDLLDEKRTWILEKNSANVPTALWGSGSSKSLVSGDQQLVNNQLTGLTVTAPAPVIGYTPGNISIKDSLSYNPLEPGTNPLISGLQPSGPVPFQSDQTIALIGKIMDAGVKTNRDSIFNSLALIKIFSGSNDSLSDFAAESSSLFTDEPLLTTGNS